MLSVLGNVIIWVLKEGDGCGLARFLVAFGGGGFAVARMSADDRGSMDIGVGGDTNSGGGLGAVKETVWELRATGQIHRPVYRQVFPS